MSVAPNKHLDGMALYCAVYDGPLWWQGRNAFEQIEYLRSLLAEVHDHGETIELNRRIGMALVMPK